MRNRQLSRDDNPFICISIDKVYLLGVYKAKIFYEGNDVGFCIQETV
jgi:hypothetical protein